MPQDRQVRNPTPAKHREPAISAMLSSLFDVMPHVTWLYGPDAVHVLYENVAFERVFGRSRATVSRRKP